MNAWIEIREGARSGTVHRLGDEAVVAGRLGDAQLRMDPHLDLAVSGRHAQFFPTPGGWGVRDLGSTNGTWVNDVALEGDHTLGDGDQVRLGASGPLLVFHAGAGTPGTVRTAAGAVRVGGHRGLWIVVAAAVVALSGGAYLAGRVSSRRDWERERAAMETRMDSMLEGARSSAAGMRAANDSLSRAREQSVESLELRVSGLLDALRQSESEVRALRSSLQESRGNGMDDVEVEQLRRRLQTVSVALERQQLAASLDFAAIEKATRRSTAQVYADTPAGVVTGTAFGVVASGIVMTSLHVVDGADGRPPTRIAVQFADSRQSWPARVVAVSREADLALLQIERLQGTIPLVKGFNERADTLASGAPVAILGFPLGGRPPEGSAGVVRPLLTAGVISGRRAGVLELQGYGEEGASGSPVLDADGLVVGVLRGGLEGDRRVLVAVPAREALALLRGR